MIASQAVRLASPSPRAARGARRTHARQLPLQRESAARSREGQARTAVRSASWDLRIFGLAIAAIVLCFGLAVVYVSQTTALSVAGYDVQKLAGQRDEIRRQNALLEVQGARLESPARIATDAQRLGMVHARYVPVIPAQPLTAKR